MAAEERSLTRAAERLRVTQPTLSRQLGRLEDELGATLFARGRHGISLTEDGMLLQRRAQEILSLAEKAAGELEDRGGRIAGEISIGSGELRSFSLLSDLLASFKAAHPGVRTLVMSGDADFVKDWLEKGLLDIGLMLEPADASALETARLPRAETWAALVREDSRLARKKRAEPRDLASVPLHLPCRQTLQGRISKWFGGLFPSLEVAGRYNLLYNTAVAIQRGQGAALCLTLDMAFEGLVFVPLRPKMEAKTILAWKRGQRQSRAVSAFIEHAKNALKA
jgi:DNA-binding transcriptional LysR family regulator